MDFDDERMNLLKSEVYSYLLDIADSGRLRALLGGPPCRTMSRLRFRQPGPPPLREREGPFRFGLPHLDPVLKKQVEDDTILWLRQMYLHDPDLWHRGAYMTMRPRRPGELSWV